MSQSFDPKASLIVVPALISGPKSVGVAHLALDTGATTTTSIDEVSLRFLGFDPEAAQEHTEIVTASGIESVPGSF